jgi:hypothetical protein
MNPETLNVGDIVADLQKPKLPIRVFNYDYIESQDLYRAKLWGYTEDFTPSGLRAALRQADKELEDAGVTLP